jgi:acetyl esterase/lipase
MKIPALPLVAAIALAPSLAAQSNSTPPQDSATFGDDGAAHITRVVPMPSTISPEAQQWLSSLTQQKGGEQTLAERRARTDEWRKYGSGEARKYYPANVEETTTTGVRTHIIMPLTMPEANRNRVLINLHGGGFNSDSGSAGGRGCALGRVRGAALGKWESRGVCGISKRGAGERRWRAARRWCISIWMEP